MSDVIYAQSASAQMGSLIRHNSPAAVCKIHSLQLECIRTATHDTSWRFLGLKSPERTAEDDNYKYLLIEL
jgi:hypothetical protein